MDLPEPPGAISDSARRQQARAAVDPDPKADAAAKVVHGVMIGVTAKKGDAVKQAYAHGLCQIFRARHGGVP